MPPVTPRTRIAKAIAYLIPFDSLGFFVSPNVPMPIILLLGEREADELRDKVKCRMVE
jgi:hypothetical protein